MIFPKNLTDMKEYIVLQAQREICTQIIFALAAYGNITKKAETDRVTIHSSIHSFLTHCSNISRLLWSPTDHESIKHEIGDDLASVLGVPHLPLLANRDLRNDLDHYEERLVRWIKKAYPDRMSISNLTVGDITLKGSPGTKHLRHYDPSTTAYTFEDHEIVLANLKQELLTLQKFLGCFVLLDQ